jgi:hypothetical protein
MIVAGILTGLGITSYAVFQMVNIAIEVFK